MAARAIRADCSKIDLLIELVMADNSAGALVVAWNQLYFGWF